MICFLNKILAIVQGILPTCLEVIQRKRDILMSRIWKVAAISTVSGVMPIPGFNLTADLDLLRSEIQLYRSQFGVTDQILEDSSNCPGNCRLTEMSFNERLI